MFFFFYWICKWIQSNYERNNTLSIKGVPISTAGNVASVPASCIVRFPLALISPLSVYHQYQTIFTITFFDQEWTKKPSHPPPMPGAGHMLLKLRSRVLRLAILLIFERAFTRCIHKSTVKTQVYTKTASRRISGSGVQHQAALKLF